MWQTMLWQIFLFLLPYVLKIAKEWVQKIMKLVEDAQKKEDLTGSQKKELVLSQIKEELVFSEVSLPVWVINTVIEIGVGYIKTK